MELRGHRLGIGARDALPTRAGSRSDTPSLCPGCAFVRVVRGRAGQTYLLCRNESIPAKYPAQPVRACPGFTASAGS